MAYNILHKLGTKQEPIVRPGDRVRMLYPLLQCNPRSSRVVSRFNWTRLSIFHSLFNVIFLDPAKEKTFEFSCS